MSIKMRAAKDKQAPTKSVAPVYELKITLEGIEPPILRRVLVSGDLKLGELHSFF